MAKLDQIWYEKAADIIASSYTRPADRLSALNELWGEYLYEINHASAGLKVKIDLSDEWFYQSMNRVLTETIGLTLQQVKDYAEEMMKNGKNETQATVADVE